MRGALPFFALLALLAPARSATALERPALLEEKEGCERWLGNASGNDPSVRLNLRLCAEGEEVHGEAQWSSLESGWNVREVRGRWQGEELRLADVRIVEQRAEPGWRFCTIDRWELTRRGEELVGRYVSTACSDEARVRLARVADEDVPAGGGEGPGQSGDMPPPPAPLPLTGGGAGGTSPPQEPVGEEAPAADARGCGGCALAGHRGAPVAGLLILLLAAAGRRHARHPS
jgi:hypothetical protein